jgi:peptide/nickel transport system substrate-binding protein
VLRIAAPVLGVALALLACTPAQPRDGSGAEAAGQAPKRLVMAMEGPDEPDSPAMYGRASGFANLEHYFIFHGNLTKYDPTGGVATHVAQKVPTLDDGDWKLLPAGGMEVTWKIRPDVVWHDGTPLAAEDFVFGFRVVKDPELAVQSLSELPNISDARALDPHTLVLTWKTQAISGNVNAHDGVPALPRHLLEGLYAAGDRAGFENSPFWKDQWAGIGPYRLKNWVLGSHIEATAMEQYFLGRPKIDELVIRYVGDPNALVAAVIAGQIDVVPMGGKVDIGQTVIVRRAWEATDGGVALPIPFGVRTIYLQFRDPTAPWARDGRVRQALIHSLDRKEFVDALLFGLNPLADYFVPPEDPVHRLAERQRLPSYAYDPARAGRLLADAGWTRGTDGLFRNNAGEPFVINVTSSSSGDNVRENEAIAGQWSAAGFQSTPTPYGRGVGSEDAREIRHTQKGALIWPWTLSATAVKILTSPEIGTERNRWRGNNYSGYVNPTYEGLYEKLIGELDATKRPEVLFQMIKILAEELPVLPIFYSTLSLVARRGVEGPGPVAPIQTANSWNVHTWELKGR